MFPYNCQFDQKIPGIIFSVSTQSSRKGIVVANWKVVVGYEGQKSSKRTSWSTELVLNCSNGFRYAYEGISMD